MLSRSILIIFSPPSFFGVALDPLVREILDLLFRWVHIIAGIMWIGNSMLFNHTDRNLEKSTDAKPESLGRIWWLHGGGFYHVEKQTMPTGVLPEKFTWFMWQSYTTWISGFFLLMVVYYFSRGLLVDPAVADLSQRAGIAIGLGTLFGGFLIYDLLWRSPLGKMGLFPVIVSIGILFGTAWALLHVLSARAAFLHVGALLGTCMSGNVFMHIIPSQRKMVAKLRAGGEHDLALGAAAKTRSIHNNYLTFPMLFLMISNHFPGVYGHRLALWILVVLIAGSMGVRHLMNIRFTYRRWRPAMFGVVTMSLIALVFLLTRPASILHAGESVDDPNAPPVSFIEVQGIIMQRCHTCHAAKPTDEVWKSPPLGVMFDTPEQIRQHAERIRARAVDTKTMPLANKTNMTDQERLLLGRWLHDGAKVE